MPQPPRPGIAEAKGDGRIVVSGTGRVVVSAPPTVVETGLRLWLDAGDRTSQPGSGTTWSDLTSNGYDGTLTGAGVTYESDHYGSLAFDGGSSQVDLNTSLSSEEFTVTCWMRCTGAANQRMLVSKETTSGPPWNQRMYLQQTTGYLVGDVANGGSAEVIQSTNLADGEWRMVTFTRNTTDSKLRLWVGSTNVATADDGLAGSVQNAQEVWIGRSAYTGSQPFLGNIGLVLIQNRPLTAAQILQNQNATRERFGL